MVEEEHMRENIGAVHDFYVREEQGISRSQRMSERLNRVIGQPIFLGLALLFVAVWMSANAAWHEMGFSEFDPAPFFWLQGMIGLGALMTTTIVLIKQNRMARLAEQRAHLDLKIALLTEHKVAKLIDLIEELRRDLPNVSDRVDHVASELIHAMDARRLSAILFEPAHSSHEAPARPGESSSVQLDASDDDTLER